MVGRDDAASDRGEGRPVEDARGAPAHEHGGERAPDDARTVYSGTGLYVGFVVLAILAIALAIFAAQNTESVVVTWTAFEFRTPLIVVILVTVIATAIATELAGVIWRRNRRRTRNEREELARLRGTRRTPADRTPDRG